MFVIDLKKSVNMSFIIVASISQLHQLMGLPRPQHPLISLVDVSKIQVTEEQVNVKVIFDFYMVSLKDKSCGVEYGRNTFDFDEGVMIFTAPGQVYKFSKPFKVGVSSLFWRSGQERNRQNSQRPYQ